MVDDTCVVKKFIRVVPPCFTQVVVSIEMFCDLKKMTVEELVGHLRAAEDQLDDKVEQIVDKTGHLLLTEEDWLEKHKHRFQAGSKEGGGGAGGSHSKGKTVARSDGGGSGAIKLTSKGTPRRKGHYRNCGIYGHWVRDFCLLAQSDDESWRWHARFGHLNFRALHDLGAKNMVEGMPTVKRVEKVCDGCALGKQHRTPFPQVSSYRTKKGLELVHADLCGHITPKTLGGSSYFLLVVDDHNRYMWVEMLKTKDQALDCFKKIKLRAEMESGGKLKALRTYRGGEFTSNPFSIFYSEGGIKHYTTTPYSPQQNGVVEC
ncbi:unnamed protein product [Miscanthus lutarioriparius]|uniref:Integrase catalytic domain-containing protein n=1 Tax=Miscanthus lutarioriparius TaxID=422564 RepID=A0A811QEP6_9POAL|nr:unnamed protein product [Miscanthus lutarioriparius]